MVVYHMVWIKLKEGVSTSSPEVTKFLTESAERLGPIHGVLHVRAGLNFTERARGFELGLLVLLDSRAALQHYQGCTEHIAYKSDVLAPLMGDIMAFDFEDAAL